MIAKLHCRVKGMFSAEVRPKTGSPTLFSAETEGDIALYMKHCSLLRIPRSRKLLKQDICHFVQYKNLKIPNLAEGGPGNNSYNVIVIST